MENSEDLDTYISLFTHSRNLFLFVYSESKGTNDISFSDHTMLCCILVTSTYYIQSLEEQAGGQELMLSAVRQSH